MTLPFAATGERVLLTGAGGFVGARLAPRLSAAGACVLPVLGPGQPGGRDLAEPGVAAALVSAARPHIIVHLAALSSVGEALTDPLGVWANVRSTDALAQAALDLPHQVRFVFASSGEVYGDSFNRGEVDEDSPLVPMNAYARSKVAGEYLLRDAATGGLDVIVLRLFNHSGPGQDERFALSSFAAQIAAIEQGIAAGPLRHGNLDVERDFSDIEDVLDAYMAVVGEPRGQGGFAAYNVGTGRAVPLIEPLRMLLAMAQLPVATAADPARMRPPAVPRMQAAVHRFSDRYGVRLQRPLEPMLGRLLAWQRARTADIRPAAALATEAPLR